MSTVVLPTMKTIIEKKEDGTKSVWFKYENVSNEFVEKLNNQIHENIWAVNVTGVANFPIPLPEEEKVVIDTLVETVKLLDSNTALTFVKANKDRIDKIGYLPLIWAAARCLGTPVDAVEKYLNSSKGREKEIWEKELLPKLNLN